MLNQNNTHYHIWALVTQNILSSYVISNKYFIHLGFFKLAALVCVTGVTRVHWLHYLDTVAPTSTV